MKRTVDTSVLVAAFGSWHMSHQVARRALGNAFVPIAHTLLEAYSTLTRMPAPVRVTPADALTYLESCVDRTPVALDKDSPLTRLVLPSGGGQVIGLPSVGGLHHRYGRPAA